MWFTAFMIFSVIRMPKKNKNKPDSVVIYIKIPRWMHEKLVEYRKTWDLSIPVLVRLALLKWIKLIEKGGEPVEGSDFRSR